MTFTKPAAAGVSIASNALLIALKLAAAAITGSIAILSEALHSMIDLIASVIAFIAVRRADEPADEDHPYGHQKMESVAASIEGMLILVGAGIIIYESVRRLATGADVAGQVEELAVALPQVRTSRVILVSNEVGLGIVPDNALARSFRDLAGSAHQQLAQICTDVYFVAAGLPLTLKGTPPAMGETSSDVHEA